jgi:hypothetical protein
MSIYSLFFSHFFRWKLFLPVCLHLVAHLVGESAHWGKFESPIEDILTRLSSIKGCTKRPEEPLEEEQAGWGNVVQ